MRASVGIRFFCLVLAVHGFGLASEPEAENKRGSDRVGRQAGDGKKEDKARLVIEIAYSVCKEGKAFEDVTIDGVDLNDREELLACLKRRADEAGKDDKGKSKLLVQFKVDGRVRYSTVADIIKMCRRLDISRIQFADVRRAK